MKRNLSNSRESLPVERLELRQRPSIATSSMAEPHLSMETLVTQGLYNPFDEDSGHLNNGGGQILNTDSCQNIISDLPSRNMVHILGDESNRKHVTMRRPQEYRSLPQETQADKIVSEMEKDTELMEDNPVSEQLRMETLREMPESLTMKRIIKKRLKTASQNSKHRPISLWKRFKYRLSMSWTKFNLTVKTVLYSFELWYSSLKVIEGHFGSSVATYFRFLRWLFILNTIVLVLSFSFIVIPQLLYRLYEGEIVTVANETNSNTSSSTSQLIQEELNMSTIQVTSLPFTTLDTNNIFTPKLKANPYGENSKFTFGNLLTGEGFFTNTTLYYGYYTNNSVQLIGAASYSMPNAYFFTMVVCYLLIFITLSISMATSYRRSFIETSGGLQNVFSHKVFCGWDFSIATVEAATLKSKNIYNELKELLSDESNAEKQDNFWARFYTVSMQVALNIVSVVFLAGTGVLMWYLLSESEHNAALADLDTRTWSMLMPLVVTLIMMIAPVFFSWIVRYENYSNPRTSLFVTLLRTYFLEIVVVGVLMAFWLKRSQDECWETSIGQEVYRLILVDFFITIIGTSLAEFVRFRIYKTHWKRLGAPEFDVARNTLNLIYNQTLFFVGFYFSPLLAAVIVIKMFIMFYIRKVGVLKNCVPSHRAWRAAQTQTLFLGLAFLSLLGVIILLVYIMTKVQASDCGPFRGYPYMYQMILEGVLNLKQGSSFLNVILFLVKPGVVAGVLVAMCMTVYYMRAKAQAHAKMVDILRVMLVSEAKDKEFLLSYISRVTEGKWMYNLRTHSEPPRQSKQGGDFMRGSRTSKLPQSSSSFAADRASIFSPNEAGSGVLHRSSTNLENKTNVYRPSPNMRQQNRSVGSGLHTSTEDRYNHSNERLQDRSFHL